ncbi:MAG TPA: redoxin family protein, partial [Terriglobales bacterium]|nr:redoxin family protein [Terriglobales bacterium]
CVKRMAQFESAKPEFAAAGISLVFVAAEKRNGIFKPEKFFQKHPHSYPFLLDEDRSVTRGWGVYQRLRADAIHIARAATFVVDQAGVVRWMYVGSQQDRAPIATVLQQARAARS